MTLQPPNQDVKRSYKAPRREAQAEETRRAIFEAAFRLFTEQGFTQTTIKQVAEKASVSEQTVYNVSGDKIGLLYEAAMYQISLGGSDSEAELLQALRTESDPMERIRMVARFSRKTWEGGALELELMVFNPDVKDPRLVDLAEHALANNLEVARAICAILFPNSIRRPDLSLDDIATFATAVDSAATVTRLLKLGWSMAQWEQWVTEFLTLFLDPAWVSKKTPH